MISVDKQAFKIHFLILSRIVQATKGLKSQVCIDRNKSTCRHLVDLFHKASSAMRIHYSILMVLLKRKIPSGMTTARHYLTSLYADNTLYCNSAKFRLQSHSFLCFKYLLHAQLQELTCKGCIKIKENKFGL